MAVKKIKIIGHEKNLQLNAWGTHGYEENSL